MLRNPLALAAAAVLGFAVADLPVAAQEPESPPEAEQPLLEDVDEAREDRKDDARPRREFEERAERAAKTENERLLGVNVTRTPGNGAFVVDVLPGSPASRAGIRVADYLLEFEGIAVESPPQLTEAINRLEEDEAEVRVWRNGEELTADVNFGKPEPEPELDEPEEHTRRQSAWLGVTLKSEPGDDVQGVRILRVFPSGPAARAGMRSGDVLQRVGETQIRSAGDVREAIEQLEVGEMTKLVVKRRDLELPLTARLGFRRPGLTGANGEPLEYDADDPGQFRDEYGQNVPITERDIDRETTRRLFEQNERLERLVLNLTREVEELKQRVGDGENAGRERGNEKPERKRRGSGTND